MSFPTRESNRKNSRRRYIFESPAIHSTTIPISNDHQDDIKSHNKNSFRPYLNKSSRNIDIDDPWVKELLKREIDFSKIDQQEQPVEILYIPQHFDHQDNFQTRAKRPYQSQQYSPRSYSSSKQKSFLQMC
jgi:hypothetical protein